MVLKAEYVDSALGGREDLVPMREEEALSLLKRAFFVDRDIAEEDERFRQVIPYVILVQGNEVLLMRRTRRQQERRLHGKYTLGIGGHIREEDGDSPIEAFRNGMMREIFEEVVATIRNVEFVGLINHLGNPVSRVHLGYLYLAFGWFEDVREKENFEWKLVPVQSLKDYEGRMEGWSRIALEFLRSYLPPR